MSEGKHTHPQKPNDADLPVLLAKASPEQLLRALNIRLESESEITTDPKPKYLYIAESELSLHLYKHRDKVAERQGWTTPFGFLVTILVTLTTCSFKNVIFGADVWQTVFIIAGLISLVWFLRALWKAYHAEKIEDIIEVIKGLSKDHRPS